MLLNLLILAAFIALGYWWSLQGFFSGLVHLLLVIAAGALALAFWEPLARLLFPYVGAYTWGVCLLGPFIIFLFVFRMIIDQYARGDVRLQVAVDYAGGAVCGVLAVWISAGLTLISLGFLPLPTILLGYQPLIIADDGQIVANPNGKLRFNVDGSTGAFYAGLSDGAFASGTPLQFYQPQLARQATLFRMGYDPNSSVVAVPRSVELNDCCVADTPVTYFDEASRKLLSTADAENIRAGGYRLVAIDTTWHNLPQGTFDLDQSLRIFPTQIRLVSVSDHPDQADQPLTELDAPVAFSREAPETHDRIFCSLNDNSTFLYSQAQTTKAAWIFLIPNDRHPQFLLVRHSRLDINAIKANDTDDLTAMLGHSVQSVAIETPEAPTPGANSDKPSAMHGRLPGMVGVGVDISDALADTVSRNSAGMLQVQGHAVVSGEGKVGHVERYDQDVVVDHILFPGNQTGVRIRMERAQAQSLLGAAISAAASLNPVYLQSDTGDKYFVVAYDWNQTGYQTQFIHVDLYNPLTSARQLPVREMGPGDVLYIYFAVPKGVKITQFHIGEGSYQDMPFTIPK